MDNAPAGTIPPTTTPESNPPPAAPAPGSSLPSNESALSERAKNANSPAAIRAVIEEAKKRVPIPAPTPAPTTPEAQPEEKEKTAETPEGTAPEAEAGDTDEGNADETAPETDAEPEADDDQDGQIKIPTAKQLRVSPPMDDQVGRLAAQFMRRNRDWKMEAAVEAARKRLGIKPAVEAQAPAPAANGSSPANNLPETVEATRKEINRLEDEYDAANIALDFEKAAEIRKQVRSLHDHRETLAEQARARQQEESEAITQKFDEAIEEARQLFPFLDEPESPAYKRMLEIQEDWRAIGSPLYSAPDKVLQLAHLAATELRIPPRRKGAAATPAKAVVNPPPAPPKPKQVLPTGGSRTVVPTTTPETAIQAKVAGITKVHEFRKFMSTLGKP